jgi:hypothetical protein
LIFSCSSLKKQPKSILYKGRLLNKPNGYDEPNLSGSFDSDDYSSQRLVRQMYTMPSRADLAYVEKLSGNNKENEATPAN